MIDLEAIKARRAALPSLPWETGTVHPSDIPYVGARLTTEVYSASNEVADPFLVLADCADEGIATFVANAPADIAALFTEIERLQEQLTFTQDQLNVCMHPPSLVETFTFLSTQFGAAFEGIDPVAYERELRDDDEVPNGD